MLLAERLYQAAAEAKGDVDPDEIPALATLAPELRAQWAAAAEEAERAFLSGDAPVSPFRSPGMVILSDRADVGRKLRETFHFRPSEGMTESNIEQARRLALYYQALAREIDDAGILTGEALVSLHASWLWTAEHMHRRGR